jgi:hypothetical protein
VPLDVGADFGEDVGRVPCQNPASRA